MSRRAARTARWWLPSLGFVVGGAAGAMVAGAPLEQVLAFGLAGGSVFFGLSFLRHKRQEQQAPHSTWDE